MTSSQTHRSKSFDDLRRRHGRLPLKNYLTQIERQKTGLAAAGARLAFAKWFIGECKNKRVAGVLPLAHVLTCKIAHPTTIRRWVAEMCEVPDGYGGFEWSLVGKKLTMHRFFFGPAHMAELTAEWAAYRARKAASRRRSRAEKVAECENAGAKRKAKRALPNASPPSIETGERRMGVAHPGGCLGEIDFVSEAKRAIEEARAARQEQVERDMQTLRQAQEPCAGRARAARERAPSELRATPEWFDKTYGKRFPEFRTGVLHKRKLTQKAVHGAVFIISRQKADTKSNVNGRLLCLGAKMDAARCYPVTRFTRG